MTLAREGKKGGRREGNLTKGKKCAPSPRRKGVHDGLFGEGNSSIFILGGKKGEARITQGLAQREEIVLNPKEERGMHILG